MKALVELRHRLRVRPDSEHEQAVLRIVIVAVVLIYMGLTYVPHASDGGHSEILLVQGLAADLVFAAGLFAAICAQPAINVPRRLIGMLSDAAAATFCMFLAGESGISMIGVYLFITFGNGFRYGRSYLFACQALCLLGFNAVLLFSPYWQKHHVAGWGLMVALIVLPLYVSTLLKRIHEARARAEDANRAKSSFLANMSHEMRTPLNGIVGVADLLQTTQLNGEQSELMRLLRHSVSLLRSLVDDVLDISKIEAGRLTIERIDFDLHGVLNGLVRLLRPHAASKGLRFHLHVDPAIEYRVKGDPHHVRQVLLNLMSNAIKFTDAGEIEVTVSQRAETDSSSVLRFEVRDTGIGITQEAQARIFDQFAQADESTTRRYGGTGLGTAIAKQLVELMGGAIGVSSTIGAGSTFWFELPMGKQKIQEGDVLSCGRPMDAESKEVLLVANDPAHVAKCIDFFAAAGYRVRRALSTAAAIEGLESGGCEHTVQAIAVAGEFDDAYAVLAAAAVQASEEGPAVIYLCDRELTLQQASQIRHFEGTSVISLAANARLLRNAIHAATTREARVGAEVIDLSTVLKQQRQPLCVLVAEDNATNQTILRQFLENAGHHVLLASNGEDALDLYEQGVPDLAILDFNMPERSGVEVVSAIRVMEKTGSRLPIIILSASVTPEARDRSIQAGADEFLGKPFEAAQLLQTIDRLARGCRIHSGPNREAPNRTAPVLLGAMPLLDKSRMREIERIASNAEFVDQLLDGFRVDVLGLSRRLETAVANHSPEQIHDLTHAMKGAALGVGAHQLAARAAALDSNSGGPDERANKMLLMDLRRCLDATLEQLTVYSSQRQRKTM